MENKEPISLSTYQIKNLEPKMENFGATWMIFMCCWDVFESFWFWF